MECTYCNAELTHEDTYGKYLGNAEFGEIHGEIYRCPNHVGFDTEEEANEYLKLSDETLKSLECESWDEVVCSSSVHHASGSFYTDKDGNLYEGYPC